MAELRDKDGRPIPKSEATLKAEAETQAALAKKVFDCFDKPVDPHLLMSVGINLLLQYVFQGEPMNRDARFDYMMNGLQGAMIAGEQRFAAAAATAAKLRGSH